METNPWTAPATCVAIPLAALTTGPKNKFKIMFKPWSLTIPPNEPNIFHPEKESISLSNTLSSLSCILSAVKFLLQNKKYIQKITTARIKVNNPNINSLSKDTNGIANAINKFNNTSKILTIA